MRDGIEAVHKELLDMDLQVERDKIIIQKKIMIACEACERSYELLDKAIQEEVGGVGGDGMGWGIHRIFFLSCLIVI
jgi:hypothetical protein